MMSLKAGSFILSEKFKKNINDKNEITTSKSGTIFLKICRSYLSIIREKYKKMAVKVSLLPSSWIKNWFCYKKYFIASVVKIIFEKHIPYY